MARHVFVVGAPRSGTTLLQLLIGAHSGFAGCAGESGVFTRNDLFDLRRRYCGLPQARIAALLRDSGDIVSFFDLLAAAVTSGPLRFVEKTPQHVLVLGRLLRWFPEAQFVNIVRDGRDCYCSAQRNPDVPQRTGAIRFARYWRSCIRARGRAGACDRIIDVRYEDLVSETAPTLRLVMAALGHELEAVQLAGGSRASDRRSVLAPFTRLAGPVGPESIGRWAAEMTPAEVEVFQSVAAPELRAHGYVLG